MNQWANVVRGTAYPHVLTTGSCGGKLVRLTISAGGVLRILIYAESPDIPGDASDQKRT
jgi:hypothetical protein